MAKYKCVCIVCLDNLHMYDYILAYFMTIHKKPCGVESRKINTLYLHATTCSLWDWSNIQMAEGRVFYFLIKDVHIFSKWADMILLFARRNLKWSKLQS